MWLNLGIITQSEISQKEKTKIVKHHLHVESGKMTQMNLFTKQNRDTDVENKCMDTKGRREWDELRDWDRHILSTDTLYKLDNECELTVELWNSTQCSLVP